MSVSLMLTFDAGSTSRRKHRTQKLHVPHAKDSVIDAIERENVDGYRTIFDSRCVADLIWLNALHSDLVGTPLADARSIMHTWKIISIAQETIK